ncbi:MAG: ChaN family lipoprotein [Oricola sp.]|nr:ChaN family lipoprotein [Oricola sp.]
MMRIAALALAALLTLPLPAVRADDNPLIGTVWTGTGEAVADETVEEAVRAADYVLIGEIHDNPEHHAIQARLIRAMTEAGRQPSIVFEMVPRGLQSELDDFEAEGSRDVAGLGQRLKWEERGWPNWSTYQPIAEAALAAHLSLYAGDLDRETIRAIGRGERPFEPAAAYSDAMRENLAEELRISHCDLLPDEAIGPMIKVQQARDQAMATAMLDYGVDDGAVLISGSGHARKDRGVPFVLAAREPGRSTVSIGLMEVREGATDFADYLDEGETALPFDYVMFTTQADDTDHCAALKKQMGK